MSLYALGKIIASNHPLVVAALRSLAEKSSTHISVGAVDNEDNEAMNQAKVLRNVGVTFSICSSVADTDATTLWLEASTKLRADASLTEHSSATEQEGAIQALLATRLGHVCSGLLDCGEVSAIALVDGGIEEIFEGTREQCLSRIAQDVRRTWDQSPNRLYLRA
jgi:hypothetical protein